MLFRQITHDDLGCASYLIGDEDAGFAAVVDPRFEIDDYLASRQIEQMQGDDALLVDVRTDLQFDEGHIPRRRLPDDAPLLSRLGLADVIHVADGGVGTWEREGHPIER